MPLLQTIKKGKTTVSTWGMTESSKELCGFITLSDSDKSEMEKFTIERRKKEFLTVRILLSGLLGYYPEIVYDRGKKPFLVNSKLNVSISHSGNLTAVILSEHLVGIDTEKITRNVSQIAPRYLSEEELTWTSHTPDTQWSQILCWCCKEAIFKIAGKKVADFRTNILITPVIIKQGGIAHAVFGSGKNVKNIKLNYFIVHDNFVVWCEYSE